MAKSAGILLVSRINGVLYAFLSKRPVRNSETNKLHSYAGGYQVTATGKMEAEDEGNFRAGAMRELFEETGIQGIVNLQKAVHIVSPEDEHVRFVAEAVFSEVARAMKLAHLVPINKGDLAKIVDMNAPYADGSPVDKTKPFSEIDGIRMFPADKEAAVKALS